MNRSPLPPESMDLDRVLTRYFQAQMPQQWPESPIPTEARMPVRSSAALQARLTLAASVAALCGLGFTLSYVPGTNTPADPNGGLLYKGTANGEKLNRHLNPDHQPMR